MPRPSRVILVMFALTVMLFGAGMAGGPLGIESAIAASGQPFQTLQDQIEALQAQVDSLIEETSAPLRVFDGEGNDLGLYAGRDGNFDQGGAIHVFFEGTAVTGSYSPNGGVLSPLDQQAFRYESDDCTGPVFYDVAGVVGRTRDSTFIFRVGVTGRVTQEVLVGSRFFAMPRGAGGCESFSPPISTPMVPVEVFDPADIDIPLQVAPGLYVAAAES